MKVSDLVVRCLEAEGVRYVFGVPGEENEDLLFSLEDSTIEFVPTRHEQGAAFIANVWGRLTGEAGVCLTTLGPGATNLVTGVADANLDKAPLVALTAQGSTDRLHHESHQYLDIVAMFQREFGRRDDSRSRHQKRPVREFVVSVEIGHELLKRSPDLGRRRLTGEVHGTVTADRQLYAQCLGIGHFPREGDHRADRRTLGVDLCLRQIQWVFPLDGAR